MSEIAGKLNIHDSAKEYRSSLLSRIGAYATENPDEDLDYSRVFPEVYNDLKQNFWASRKSEIQVALLNVLKFFSADEGQLSNDERDSVRETLDNMKSRYGYDESSARDVIGFIVSQDR